MQTIRSELYIRNSGPGRFKQHHIRDSGGRREADHRKIVGHTLK